MVTKFFPASDVRLLADLGVTDVGENRHQEAEAKAAECARDLGLRWHFIGGLQSNKAPPSRLRRRGRVRRPASLLPGPWTAARGPRRLTSRCSCRSVSTRRTRGPAGAARRRARVGGPGGRLGPPPVLRGLMAVAPLGEDPAGAFVRLAEIRAGLLAAPPGDVALGRDERRPGAAVRQARHVRVGSAVLGSRPPRSSNVARHAQPEGTVRPGRNVMSSAMRKIGEYLGLLEDTERYDDEYDDDYDDGYRLRLPGRRPPRSTPWPSRPPSVARGHRTLGVSGGAARWWPSCVPDHHAAPAHLQRGAHRRRELPRGRR